MQGWRQASAALIGCCLSLAVLAGCGSQNARRQQLFAIEIATSSRYLVDGPSMAKYVQRTGTDLSTITEIPADSAQTITLLSASLVALPGFRTPLLLSVGVLAGSCPQTNVLLPPTLGRPSAVMVNGRRYQPLPMRDYTMEIGAGCVPQLVYVVRATKPGQYATGGLRFLVREHGRTRTMFAFGGADIWYYGSGPLPSTRQVTAGLSTSFATQVSIYRGRGG